MTASTHMTRALALAASARHATSPNPMVGAVLVRAGGVVGEGFHRRAGGPHAEVHALRAAGAAARGATLYVTLEPCAHHGRTGPCADALIAAGVSRVVAAMRDPDPRVAGRGLARLRAAGVAVDVGDGAVAARALNQRWLAARRAGRPYVGLKFAATLDGKIASSGGESRWITGDLARAEGRRLRTAYAAIAVGAGTVIADDPELTARDGSGRPGSRQPLRVVIDGRLRARPTARVFSQELPGRAVVMTTEAAAAHAGAAFRNAGVWLEALPGDGRVEIGAVLDLLAGHGVDSVLVEGGGDLAWSFLAAGAVDHVYGFVAPRLLGGAGAPTPVGGKGIAELAGALQLEFVRTRAVGGDVVLEAVAR